MIVSRQRARLGKSSSGWPSGRAISTHIGDRVVAEDETTTLEPTLENPKAAVVLVGITLMRIGVVARRIIDEMAELAGHRTEIADLPEQPFEALFPA